MNKFLEILLGVLIGATGIIVLAITVVMLALSIKLFVFITA